MTETLNPTLATYLEASNTRDVETLLGCFSAQAVVADEGHTYRGTEEIRQWFNSTVAAYSFTVEAVGATEQDEQTVVQCLVSGTFKGSPVPLRFFFTLGEHKIDALTISA